MFSLTGGGSLTEKFSFISHLKEHVKKHVYKPVISYTQIQLYTLLCVAFIMLLSACATTTKSDNIKKAEAHFKIGVSHLSKNDLKQAFIELQKAIKLDPEQKESLNYLGYISTRFKKYDEAIAYYKKAIAVAPDYSEALNNLGVTYLEMEEWDEAIDYFKMALDNPIYSTPEKAYSSTGFAYYKKQDYQKAGEAIQEALKRDPDFPYAIYIQGLLYINSQNDEAAIKEFLRVLDVLPHYVDAHWELANAYIRTGERDKAIQHFKTVAEKAKDPEIREEALEYIELLGR
jgi:type IV pilus biogenesis/stability protein PilW